MVEQNADQLAEQFGALIRWDLISESLHMRENFPAAVKFPKALDYYLKTQVQSNEVRELCFKIHRDITESLEKEVEILKADIYDLEYELAKKERVGLRRSLNTAINKLNKTSSKLNATENLSRDEDLFIYPHWESLAVFNNNGNLEVADFQYGHFRDTGLLLDDILYHLGKHPKSPKYSLYNSKVESLTPEYFEHTRRSMEKSVADRRKMGELHLLDFEKSKGIFEGSKKDSILNFMEQYSIGPEVLKNITPSNTSYLEPLFPKNKAIVVAYAFGESVMKSDFYRDRDFSPTEDKHIPVEFYKEAEPVFFPAIYSSKDFGSKKLRGLSIITTNPRPEVFDKGHDRSPITLSLEGAMAYLTENTDGEEVFELFNYYSDPTPFLHREKA